MTKKITAAKFKEVGAVANAAAILRYLASESQQKGVAEIARGTEVSPSTVFSILRTLNNERMVSFDSVDKTYRMGLGLLELTAREAGKNYMELIQSELDRLSFQFGFKLSFWRVASDSQIFMVASSKQQEGAISVSVSMTQPEFLGAAGYCIAALRNVSDDELQKRFSKLVWGNALSFEEYKAEVDFAKAAGWALDQGRQYLGVSTVASAIGDKEGLPRFVLLAIGVNAQQKRQELEVIGYRLCESAALIGRAVFNV